MSLRRATTASFALLCATAVITVPASSASAAEAGPESVPVIAGVTQPATRGALPVGHARYGIPSGAVVVDPVRGVDSAVGTQAAPVRTLRAALDKTPAKGTIVLRAGEYKGRTFIGRPVTIQNYPGEAAWFDGTVQPTTWTPAAGGWQTALPGTFDRTVPGSSDPFVGPQAPMAGAPDLVFVDGQRIEQVDHNPGAGQFAVDAAARTLTLGFDPAGHDVRVSDQAQAIVVGTPDVTLRGFGVRRYANSIQTYGALYLARPRITVENVVVEDVATTGITLTSDGSTGAGRLDHVTVRRAGMLGIHGTWADGGVIRNSVVEDSNYERFNGTPTSAGIKVGRTRSILIDNNKVVNSRNATGIWLDEAVVGFTIARNHVENNGETGIEAELSSSGTIISNAVTGHRQGIFLFDSEKVRVVNNTLGYNTMSDLHMVQDFRRQADPNSVGRDPRYPMGDPTNTWLLRDIAVKNNMFGADGAQKSLFQVYVMDRNTNRPADTMNITLTGNAFSPKATADNASAVAWGTGDNVHWATYDTVDAWAKAVRRSTTTNTTVTSTDFGIGAEEARWHPVAEPLASYESPTVGAPTGFTAIGSLVG